MPFREGAGGSAEFGDVGGYPLCSCCGGFHAVYESGVVSPFGALNADDRGGSGPNGKLSFSTDQAAAQLGRSNITWGSGLGQSANVTFAFRSSEPATLPTDTNGFQRFTDVQIAVTLQALQAWADVANITFTRVNDGDGYSNNATMLFSNYTSGQGGSAAFAYLPGATGVNSNSGDVWINSSLSYNANPVLLGYGFQVLTHEIGHAIGLSHPAAYNAGEGVSISYANDAVYYEDSRQYTVMSYFSASNTGGNHFAAGGTQQYSAVPLLDDIAAVQRLYGVNLTTRTGDTVYGFNSNADRTWYQATSASTDVIFAVWDAGGTDTLDFSGYGDNTVIDLRQGAFSSVGGLTGNVAIAVGAVIENAVGGSGAERIYGNPGDNRITPGLGADTIDGGLGWDTVVFSGPRSAYTITLTGNQTVISGPDGAKYITNVEFFQFSDERVTASDPTTGFNLSGDITNNLLIGNGASDTLAGGAGSDTLNGNDGDDYLYGGTGADVLNGGDGQDRLFGGPGDDTIDGGPGTDSITLPSVEGVVMTINLTTGVATGEGTDVVLNVERVGGSANPDDITATDGDNLIDGGSGSDTIRTLGGNDYIQLGRATRAGGAPDIVKDQATANGSIAAAVNLDGAFDLASRADVTNSTTVPHATVVGRSHGGVEYYAFSVVANVTVTFDIDAASFDTTLRIFNASGVELAANDDNNSDGGPTTDSRLTYTFQAGGTYYVQVAEWSANSGGTFTSKPPAAGSTYTLHVSVPGHPVVELAPVGAYVDGGSGNDTVYANDGPDTVFGGEGADSIFGGGGDDGLLQGNQGADTINGAWGNDFIFGGQGDDILDGGTENDFVQGNIGADLVSGGFGADTLLGGQGADTIYGEDGADLILGDLGNDELIGGAGADTLQGGAGADILNGGDGIDIAAYTKAVGLHYIEAVAGGGWRIYDGASDVDTLNGVEWGWFAGAAPEDLNVLAGKGFDAYGYMLGYPDLLNAYRNDPLGAYLHYFREGQSQGRVADSFDGLAYIASHNDLISLLGLNGNGGSRHYVLTGQAEGRTITFSATNYLNAHADLRAAFGNDLEAATRHYIQYGFAEGRFKGAPASATTEEALKAPFESEIPTASAASTEKSEGAAPLTLPDADPSAGFVFPGAAEGSVSSLATWDKGFGEDVTASLASGLAALAWAQGGDPAGSNATALRDTDALAFDFGLSASEVVWARPIDALV